MSYLGIEFAVIARVFARDAFENPSEIGGRLKSNGTAYLIHRHFGIVDDEDYGAADSVMIEIINGCDAKGRFEARKKS